MGGSGLNRTEDFQKICRTRLVGLNFFGSGLDSDWKISQSAHLCSSLLDQDETWKLRYQTKCWNSICDKSLRKKHLEGIELLEGNFEGQRLSQRYAGKVRFQASAKLLKIISLWLTNFSLWQRRMQHQGCCSGKLGNLTRLPHDMR